MTKISNWRKSTRSNGSNGSCVEVGTTTSVVAVRDTKDRAGGQIEFSRSDWSAFTGTL